MYGKVFASMYDGSLRTKSPWEALVTFQQMIVLANKHGELDMTADALSFRTGIPLEIIKTGIAALEQPDPDSRTPGEDGRRIVLLDPEGRNWGWRIVNYPIYRDMRNAEERREYMRLLMQDRRAAKKRNGVTRDVTPRNVSDVNTPLAPVSNVSQGSKQYAEVEAITPQPPKANGNRTGARMKAALLLKTVRKNRSPQFPTSLVAGWQDDFDERSRAVIDAVGIERILTTAPANDGPLQRAVMDMFEESE
jgi:hypothetical protein